MLTINLTTYDTPTQALQAAQATTQEGYKAPPPNTSFAPAMCDALVIRDELPGTCAICVGGRWLYVAVSRQNLIAALGQFLERLGRRAALQGAIPPLPNVRA